MKFVKEHTGENLVIPAAALKVSGFEAEKVELHALKDAVVILKGRMTAMELVNAIDALAQLSTELIVELSKACGHCDGCEDGCPFDEDEEDEIALPDYLREEAGIPQDAKLCAEVEEGAVTIMEAGYEFDLRDVPHPLLQFFHMNGTCVGELEEHLIVEDIVYGK